MLVVHRTPRLPVIRVLFVSLCAAVLGLLVAHPATGLSSAGAPSAVTLPAVAGAWVDSSRPAETPSGDYSTGKINQVVAIYEHRAFFRFDLASIPPGAHLAAATLRIYQLGGTGEDPTRVTPALVTRPWDPATVTWNTQPSVGTMLRAASIEHAASSGWDTIDVTAMVQGWLSGTANYGLRLSADHISSVTFSRRIGFAPVLEVVYTLDTATPTHTRTPTQTPTRTPTRTPSPSPTTTVPASTVAVAQAHGWARSDAPNTNNSGALQLHAGWSGVGPSGIAQGDMSYVHFDVPALEPRGCYKKAHLKLYQELDANPAGYTVVWEVVQAAWKEATLTWNNAPPAAPSDIAPLDVGNGAGWKVWDASAVVNRWMNGSVANNGLRVVGARKGDGSPLLGERVFGSRLSAHPPSLELEWVSDWQAPVIPNVASSHPTDAWHDDPDVTMNWSGATDGSGCGIEGFAYRWSTGPDDEPGEVNIYANSLTTTLSPGTHWFHLRALDRAGNWSETIHYGPVKIRAHVSLRVRYQGAGVAEAEVYRNGAYMGKTGAGGLTGPAYWEPGDTVSALYPIHLNTSPKRPADASWTVYATNVTIPTTGAPQIFVFGDVAGLTGPVTIDVDGDRPVIGFSVVFSVEWDAPQAYLDDLLAGAREASRFLYDVTDGQGFFKRIAVYDNRQAWTWGDYRVQLHNQTWPCGDVGGIDDGADGDHHI